MKSTSTCARPSHAISRRDRLLACLLQMGLALREVAGFGPSQAARPAAARELGRRAAAEDPLVDDLEPLHRECLSPRTADHATQMWH